MALSASRIAGGIAAPGMAAAATARPISGGRGVAAASQPAVESTFASGVGVNDNLILRYDDEGGLNSDGQRREYGRPETTPFIARSAAAFQVEEIDQAGGAGDFRLFLNDVVRGIGVYENNIRLTTPGRVMPGSVLNQLS